jgi:starvation-inducible DNA-binding protein
MSPKPTTSQRPAARRGGGSRSTRANGAITSTRQASFTVPTMSESDGTKMAATLQDRLVALLDLSLTLKHIHWNVVGPNFIAVHKMLDPQHEGVQAMVDDLAERIATLGGVPSGLPGRLVQERSWDDYELDRADAISHLGALDLVYQGVISDHRGAIEAAGDLDPVSEDLLIGQSGILERYHWFVRSHLEDYAGGMSNAGAKSEIQAARAVATKAVSAGRSSRSNGSRRAAG